MNHVRFRFFKLSASLGRRPTRKALPNLEACEPRLLLSADVLTYHNDNARDGQNLKETILKPSNVNVSTFGKLFTDPIDGWSRTQPLVKSNVTIAGQARNVVYVTTEHDSVYAFDANAGGAPLWKTSFINPAAGVTTVPAADVNLPTFLNPEYGITGTPVIDGSTNTLYVVALTKEVSGGSTAYVQRLHALDIATGAEKFGGPTVIQASMAGTGDGPTAGGVVTFNAFKELQRPALLLANNSVYVSWASYGDSVPYHGWVLGYDAQTLKLNGVFNDTPDGQAGGVWMSGGGPAADAAGNVYFSAGNGDFNADGGGRNVSSSFVKLSAAGGNLTLADYFAPHNQAFLSANDLDIGSGGVMLLPPQPGAHPNQIVGGDKGGNIYLVDRDNMGQFNSAQDTNIQTIAGAISASFDTPAYFNGRVFFGAPDGPLVAFQTANGLLSSAPVDQISSSISTNHNGASPSISANGTANAILWVNLAGTLYAFDPNNLSTEFYDSNQAGARDAIDAGTSVYWSVPTVADGRVYVATQTGLVAYGLLPTAPVPAAPTNLVAKAASRSQIDLAWQDAAQDQDGFIIQSSTDGVNFTPIATTLGSSTTFSVTGLNSSTTYTFRVQAYGGSGNSDFSNVSSAKPLSTRPALRPPGRPPGRPG